MEQLEAHHRFHQAVEGSRIPSLRLQTPRNVAAAVAAVCSSSGSGVVDGAAVTGTSFFPHDGDNPGT